jgi:AAA15 family ATPase/GTPase
MAVDKIEIKNFTVFDNVTIKPSKGVNVIIGENGTGKTHLLKLLYAFCETEQGFDNGNNVYAINKLFTIELMKCFVTNGVFPANFEVTFESKGVKFSYGRYVFHGNEPYIELENNYKKAAQSVFIPAKDMLTHSKGLLVMSKKHSNIMPFDKTLLDIIEKSTAWILDSPSKLAKNILPALEKEMGGKVVHENDEFFIEKYTGEKIPFSCESEGIKKIGLLWQLLMNESITADTVLLWDEPEANINPNLVRALAEILLELARNGVQIFLATHDYFLAKYFEVLAREDDGISFHGLHETSEGVQCETSDKFSLLTHNPIIGEKIKLHEEEVNKVMGA